MTPSRKLSLPMTDADFQQVTLLANSIAIFEIAIKLEKAGSVRRRDYADILKRLRRVEHTIEGNLENRTLDASIAFYRDMEQAVGRFRRSFADVTPVDRDEKAGSGG